jgi:7-cyano-7-deazaguanine reductase
MKEYEFVDKIEDISPSAIDERQEEIKDIKLSSILPQKYIYKGETAYITYMTDELIALCPATGYPDFYHLEISYIPDENIPELKSLKFYMMDYYNLPIYHEHLASKILEDFVNVVKPINAKIKLSVAVRGGIGTTVEKEWCR